MSSTTWDDSRGPKPLDWEDYWGRRNDGGSLYAVIASIYRKYIIKPRLNRFVRKYFEPGASLLHAGCGTGQVDVDLHRDFKLTALDISPKALALYQLQNPGSKALLSSIFDIRLGPRSLDGIYNLGVLEHFSESEIHQILKELHRVLRDSGKLLIFWPPEFGLSVLFFKGLCGLSKVFLKRSPQFHPPEPSRLKSKNEAIRIFSESGFRVLEYSFSFSDLWTYAVVVAEKR